MDKLSVEKIAEAIQLLNSEGYHVFVPNDDETGFLEERDTQPAKPEPQKGFRIGVTETLLKHGYASLEDYLEDTMSENILSFACCELACETEPDGHCCHGNPSIELLCGII